MIWEYELKPKKIQAFQLTFARSIGKEPVPVWFAKAIGSGRIKLSAILDVVKSQYAEIKTPEGTLTAEADDYIIYDGEKFLPCAPHIFEMTYQKIDLE